LFNSKAVERCRSEQKRCRDELLKGNLDPGELRGAWLGLSDWFTEELIMAETGFPKLSERHAPCAKARASISSAVITAVGEHGLTYAELVAILTDEIRGWTNEELKAERG
jgi:hypothetical protein